MRRSSMLRVFLFICSVLSFFLAGVAHVGGETMSTAVVYRDYRDIPGVTSADVAAVERIRASRDAFVYGAGGSNETFIVDGSVGGFSRYFCDWLSALFGIPFRPAIFRLADLADNLADGHVDFTCEFPPTPEMQRRLSMTDAIVHRPVTRFRMTGAEDLSAVALRRPLRYGFVQWYGTDGLIVASARRRFETFYYTRREDAIAALRGGKIDAFVMDTRGGVGFQAFDDVKQEVFFPFVYSDASFATANRDLAPIVSVVQKFLDTPGAGAFLSEMHERGEREFQRHNFRSTLNDEEKQYIDEHVANGVAVPFAAERENYPVSFYNQQDGKFQGIAIDILHAISALSGLTFTPVDAGAAAEWADLRARLDSGEAALITELIYTRRIRDTYLWADTPYDVQRLALLSRFDTPIVTFDRISEMRVGAVRASAFEEFFRDFLPDHKHLTLYDSYEDAFDALGAGETDLIVGSVNHLLYAANYLERPDFKINFEFNHTAESAFGFGKDQHVLRGIVSKAQRIANVDKIVRDWKQRAFDDRRKVLEAQIPHQIAFAACLLLAIAASLYLSVINERTKQGLARTVANRTRELRLQTVAAQNAARDKSEFLARMSHEMRTPLNAITGMANIARNTDDRQKSLESAEKIGRASKQLRTIIDDILKLSDAEPDATPPAQSDFGVREMLTGALARAKTKARRKSQTIELRVADDVPDVVVGDGARIGQVLHNFLSNAVKFSPEGETILVGVSAGPDGTTADRIVLRFDVTDHGVGIPDEARRRLFQAFEQAEAYRDRKHSGIGIGLALSKKNVEAMGGTVDVVSRPGEGSTFTFFVPVEKP